MEDRDMGFWVGGFILKTEPKLPLYSEHTPKYRKIEIISGFLNAMKLEKGLASCVCV